MTRRRPLAEPAAGHPLAAEASFCRSPAFSKCRCARSLRVAQTQLVGRVEQAHVIAARLSGHTAAISMSMSILFTAKSSRPDNSPLKSAGVLNGALTNVTELCVTRFRVMRSLGGSHAASLRSVRLTVCVIDGGFRALAPDEPAPFGRVGRAGAQVEFERPAGHRLQRSSVAPFVRAHDLKIHPVGEQRRWRAALQRMIEPLIAQLAQIDERGLVDLVAPHRIGAHRAASIPSS